MVKKNLIISLIKFFVYLSIMLMGVYFASRILFIISGILSFLNLCDACLYHKDLLELKEKS